MTQTLVDFSADPASTWTAETGTYVWDSGNGELDADTENNYHLRYNTSPGASIEHEAQVTGLTGTDNDFEGWLGGPMVRGASGAVTGYKIQLKHNAVPAEGNFFELKRLIAGTEEDIDAPETGEGFVSQAHTINDGEWYTIRVAVEGTAGNNVVIKVWIQGHGTSKPSDPGWIGVDGSPDYTFTDDDATRLDESTHVYCGISGRNNNSNDYDTRHDFFKQRLISDRGAGASSILRQMMNYHGG